MRGVRIFILLLFLFSISIFLFPRLTSSADFGLVKSLRDSLEKSKTTLEGAEKRLRSGLSITPEIIELRSLLEEVKASHLLLQERLRAMEEEVKVHGEKAQSRHRAMAEGYGKTLLDYIALMEGLSPDGSISLTRIDALLTLLKKILPPKKKPIIGNLPYKHLRYPAKEPQPEPLIRPAYRGGDKMIRPDDLRSTSEAPISYEIAMLAQSLNWNPVSIYEWVKNNIETEWYWGSMKGAEETFRQRSGNDCDQASLLIALLRASGYPARYVRGVIEFFPDLERVKNLIGIDEPLRIAQYLQKAGIPFKAIFSGGRIANIQKEHIWVETQVPYANYRGAILDEHGKAWLGLDTSIKVTGYTYNTPLEIPENISFSTIRDQYLSAFQNQTLMEYLKAHINFQIANRPQPLTYDDLLRKRTLNPEVMNILPASMQFKQTRITHEYSEIPDELKHRVNFIATTSQGKELFAITLDASRLSNQKIILTYEPETLEDQEIIHAYGGLGNTPAYLVRLRPALKVNGERVIVGQDGLPMGSEFDLTLELISPNGIEKITNTHIAGNLSVIGIVSQNVSLIMSEGEKTAEQLLYEEAMRYIDRWNQAEEELASLLKLALTRPIPTVVTLGGVIDVTFLFDTPYGFQWKGLYVDADIKAIETVRSSEIGVRSEKEKIFMQLSALQGSVLEHRLFEDDFEVESISTAKLFGLTRSTQPVTEILTLDRTNILSILPILPFDENIKEDIQNWGNQNLTIRIPQSEITYEDWSGVGYIVENPETGESGYMLSGMIAGGMTAWERKKWQSLADILLFPYVESSNKDPLSARYIQKLSGGDLQYGFVGEILPRFLQVRVTDSAGKRVPNVEVLFKVKAGGGKLIDPNSKEKKEENTIIVKTDGSGIAGVQFRLGTKTSDNPAFMKIDSKDRYYTQVGENLVEASLKNSGIKTLKPFTAYGNPGEPRKIESRDLGMSIGDILSYVGPISIILSDQFGNPVANRAVDFIFKEIKRLSSCEGSADNRPPQLLTPDYPCAKRPLYGCGTDGALSGVLTDSAGSAMVGIILGAIPDADYWFKAFHKELLVEFKRTSHPFGNCSGGADPAVKLQLDSYYLSDAYGHNINAARSGKTIPLEATLYFLKEESTTERQTITCDGNSLTCDRIVGNRFFKHEFDSSNAWVTFGGLPGKHQGGGVFRADYELKPGINYIPIHGTGTTPVQRTILCPSCTSGIFPVTLSETLMSWAYGVDITIDPLAPVLIENIDSEGKGYSISDLSIRYTIHPQQYTALNAFVDLIEDGELIGRISAERSGMGTAIFSQGFPFNLNKKYEIQVVLNPGTGVEIKSDKKRVQVAQISVVKDVAFSYPLADEIGYGDGTIPERRYRIQIRSLNYAESCPSKGAIRVVDRNGTTVVIPSGTDYYFPEYALEFSRIMGQCMVKILDTTAEGMAKEKFILSNRSREALKEIPVSLEDIAVLYGGIGNFLQIEIDGMKKYWPIEPVGVVLIGIDGLRQDVLYPEGKDDVRDSGRYRVDIKDLSGVRQILGGYDHSEDKQRYIMLPKVTAIFPSITLASWASIFTGKLPNETGITGNEFFARDLSALNPNPIPGLSKNPAGMVTLSEGAFDHGKDMVFTLSHVIPAEISGLGIGYHPTLSSKLKDSAPLRLLSGGVKPFFEEVGKITRGKYNIAPHPDIRCDQTPYECRTVAIFFQYVEGVDFWGTPHLSNLFDIIEIIFNPKNFSAKIMDQAPASRAIDFINDYFSKRNPEGKRKRFPAVFSIYFSGLDHYAHGEGMKGYLAFFRETTDPQIRDFINALKKHGEFENKIFIIVSDHGMTEMPDSSEMAIEQIKRDEDGNIIGQKQWYGDTSCELKLKVFNKDKVLYPELANNNLHIWELAEVFRSMGENGWGRYKVLAPKEIAELFKDKNKEELPYGSTSNMNKANVIATLNGPMAHIYLKGIDDWKDKNIDLAELSNLAGRLGTYLMEGGLDLKKKDKDKFSRLLSSVDMILIREGGTYKIFRGVKTDGLGNIIGPETESITETTFDMNRYVAAYQRVRGLNNPDRSGDIVLIFKDFTNDISVNRYTSGVACKSWHGSLNLSDSYVPLIMAYPGGNKYEVKPFVDQGPICPQDKCEGNWKMTDIIQEIIKQQYLGN